MLATNEFHKMLRQFLKHRSKSWMFISYNCAKPEFNNDTNKDIFILRILEIITGIKISFKSSKIKIATEKQL